MCETLFVVQHLFCEQNDCKSGFLVDTQENRVSCPNCRRSMCQQCKKLVGSPLIKYAIISTLM